MIFGFFYDVALHCYALWGAISALFRKKGLVAITSRFGRNIPKVEGRVVWVHAVSFGEVKAAASLIARLVKEDIELVISTTTQTGYGEAKRLNKGKVLYLPFDFSYLIRPVVKKIRPELLVLTEGDFWYNFQRAVQEVGGKIVVLNGKISGRSCARLRRAQFVANRIYSTIDYFCLQTEEYKERFLALGVPKEKLTVTGNIKLDSKMKTLSKEKVEALKNSYGIRADDIVLTLGSTHHPEESLWLTAARVLWQKELKVKLFLVPRHPERVHEVIALIQKHSIAFSRVSEGGSFAKGPIILVDKMGLLLQCYRLSQLAFVGGSFTPKVGGHNLIEPAYYGVCTLFGPHLHAQPGFASLMKKYNAGLMIKSEEIVWQVEQLVEDAKKREGYGERGRRLVRESRGALEKSWDKIVEHLPLKEGL